jgi:hypothetical protein
VRTRDGSRQRCEEMREVAVPWQGLRRGRSLQQISGSCDDVPKEGAMGVARMWLSIDISNLFFLGCKLPRYFGRVLWMASEVRWRHVGAQYITLYCYALVWPAHILGLCYALVWPAHILGLH